MPEWAYITIIAILGIGWAVTVACRVRSHKPERVTDPWAEAERTSWLERKVARLEGQVDRQREIISEETKRADALDLVIQELVELNPAIGEAFPWNPVSLSLADWVDATPVPTLTRALDANKVLKHREARLRTEAITKDYEEVDAIREKFGVQDD